MTPTEAMNMFYGIGQRIAQEDAVRLKNLPKYKTQSIMARTKKEEPTVASVVESFRQLLLSQKVDAFKAIKEHMEIEKQSAQQNLTSLVDATK
jgi:hypothetical protein